jgi:hypothetical protein
MSIPFHIATLASTWKPIFFFFLIFVSVHPADSSPGRDLLAMGKIMVRIKEGTFCVAGKELYTRTWSVSLLAGLKQNTPIWCRAGVGRS